MALYIRNLENLNTILHLSALQGNLHRKKWGLVANKLNKLLTSQKFKNEVKKIPRLGNFLNKIHTAATYTKARRHFEPGYIHPNLEGSANKMYNFEKLYRAHQVTMPIRRTAASRTIQNAFLSRTTGELIANIMNQIRQGVHHNIDVTGYSPFEKKKLIKHIKELIEATKQARNSFRNAKTSTNQAVRSHAIERYGYFNNHVLAYSRALRALKPVRGNIPVPYRAAGGVSPNRPARAPANRKNNANQYSNLENEHLVISGPNLRQPAYINPNSFVGLMKSKSHVNIPVGNLKAWLRMARERFPNKVLFRHPINRNYDVKVRHVRFAHV